MKKHESREYKANIVEFFYYWRDSDKKESKRNLLISLFISCLFLIFES